MITIDLDQASKHELCKAWSELTDAIVFRFGNIECPCCDEYGLEGVYPPSEPFPVIEGEQ